jgi:hypothetical protein
MQRLAAAGRGPSGSFQASTSDRISLGDWLKSVLKAKDSGRGKGKKTRKVIVRTPRLVVLGDPGGGKTTLLRWLATAYLLRREGDPDLERLPDMASLPEMDWLPILIRCRDLDKARAGQGDLEDLLHQALAKMELPGKGREALVPLLRARMEEGRALLLVDGLDEITDPGLRAAFCERLEAIARSFSQVPMLATSRIVGYREMHRRIGQGFAHGTLAELAPEEKDDFVRRWCEVTIPDPGRREAEEEKLRSGIHGSDRIERLTTNPMLLTTMALVQRKVGKLPTRRHKLYWEAVGVLLNWRHEVEEVMDPDETLPQLEYLAYVMCDRGVQRLRRDEVLALFEDVRRDYPNIRLLQRQTPEAFLAQLERRTGLLVEAGEVQHEGRPSAVYEFRHLTFQEYLAALALLAGRFPGHEAGTTLAERVKPLAGRVAEVNTDLGPELQVTENWREVLRLCVASCNDDDVDPVLAAILEPRVPEEARPRAILAVLCLADEPNVSELRAQEILRRFAEQVKEDDGTGHPSTGADVAVAEAGLSVWVEPLKRALVDEFLRREPEKRAYLGGLAGMVASYGMPAGEAEKTEWMLQQVRSLDSPSDIETAAAALAIMQAAFSEEAPVVTGLVDHLLVLLSRCHAVAHAAAWALGWLSGGLAGDRRSHWVPSLEESRLLLQYMTAPDFDRMALRWLMIIAGDAEMREAGSACTAALLHTSDLVRASAARALGKIRDASAVDALRASLQDPEQEVRRAAVQALASLWDEDGVNKKLLLQRPFLPLDSDFEPSRDPLERISTEHVRKAAAALRIPEKEVLARYEGMAGRYDLNLGWRSGT